MQIYPRALSPAEIARDYVDPDWRLRPPNRAKLMRSIGWRSRANAAALLAAI